MIKKDKLEQFWGVVSDTLEWKDKEIVELKAETKLAQEKETQLNANIDLLKEQLKETQFEVDHIKVIGIDFTKKGFVYGGGVLLLVLILLLVVAIVKMNVSNRSASVARKDLEELRDEFENFQKRVLEKEKKLKRELTNEMNKCEELKQKLKSR
ncbi:MAG: hypothetical protein MI784_08545 [Cytophagales bacterium]|nr:hypothetical protein [Cytophagales bacterium]